jgi:hypothetical protein
MVASINSSNLIGTYAKLEVLPTLQRLSRLLDFATRPWLMFVPLLIRSTCNIFRPDFGLETPSGDETFIKLLRRIYKGLTWKVLSIVC